MSAAISNCGWPATIGKGCRLSERYVSEEFSIMSAMFGRKREREALGSRRIMAFIGTVDTARAKAFYAGALGLRLISEDGFALIFDAGGTKLRVSAVPEVVPAGYTVLGWLVPDIKQTVLELVQRSVVFQQFDGMVQDDLGIWMAPGGARVAWFRDPDGNTLSVTQTTHT
jgi:catechol 2,3-dioxygenase-like lactoylglutathione lyase family enzyme